MRRRPGRSPTARASVTRRAVSGEGEKGRWNRSAEGRGVFFASYIARVFPEGKQMSLVCPRNVLLRIDRHLALEPSGNPGRRFVRCLLRSRESTLTTLVSHQLEAVICSKASLMCCAKGISVFGVFRFGSDGVNFLTGSSSFLSCFVTISAVFYRCECHWGRAIGEKIDRK